MKTRRGAVLGSIAALLAARGALADETSPPAHSPARLETDAPSTPAEAVTRNEQDEDYLTVRVPGRGWASPRGIGDMRIRRDLLTASPRQQTSEMLSAAPGFFVDHEDGEGLGNDIYLRGFDLEHGSGIEMRLGSIPINSPTHIRGQGYADSNFIIPEVVRSIRVLQGPYDPRQGDAAIVGSAYFDVGVDERGYQLRTSYGSFNQARVVGIAAPRGADAETFSAFALRHSDGFGVNRSTFSGSAMGQWGADLGARDHLRVVASAYSANSKRPGVVREDDVDAGRIGFYGQYPHFAQNQGLVTSRLLVGADYDHVAENGAHFEIAPWVMRSTFRARQNFAGALETSQVTPSLSGLGDLFATTNRETAAGFTSRFRPLPLQVAPSVELLVEPGLIGRAGHTDQSKLLLVPATLRQWDSRLDVGLETVDAGAYVDLDVRVARRLRVSGGARADLLMLSVNGSRTATAIAPSPRATIAYELAPELTPSVSYGEGFRSLDAESVMAGVGTPYSKVRSAEAGVQSKLVDGRYMATAAVFQTWVANELVFEAEAGGLDTQRASDRRGFVGSFVAKPNRWLIASSALSVTSAVYATKVPGVSHFVPNVPPILWRMDVTARGPIATVWGTALIARVGAGYTFLSGRHLSDTVIGPANHVLNASAGLRRGPIELGVDGYNILALQYADEASLYASNWSVRPGQQLASRGIHFTAAPPLTVLATLALYAD